VKQRERQRERGREMKKISTNTEAELAPVNERKKDGWGGEKRRKTDTVILPRQG
jgi:hypothetical protein